VTGLKASKEANDFAYVTGLKASKEANDFAYVTGQSERFL
jgi:hypothetical protein